MADTRIPRTYRLERAIAAALEANAKLRGVTQTAILDRALRVELGMGTRDEEPDEPGGGDGPATAGAGTESPGLTPVVAPRPDGIIAASESPANDVDLEDALEHDELEVEARQLAEDDGISLVAARLIVGQRR